MKFLRYFIIASMCLQSHAPRGNVEEKTWKNWRDWKMVLNCQQTVLSEPRSDGIGQTQFWESDPFRIFWIHHHVCSEQNSEIKQLTIAKESLPKTFLLEFQSCHSEIRLPLTVWTFHVQKSNVSYHSLLLWFGWISGVHFLPFFHCLWKEP